MSCHNILVFKNCATFILFYSEISFGHGFCIFDIIIRVGNGKMMIDCHKCEHYYVTWNKEFPHGCRVLGFISRQLPNIVVRSSTPEMYCLSFRKKTQRNITTQAVRSKVL